MKDDNIIDFPLRLELWQSIYLRRKFKEWSKTKTKNLLKRLEFASMEIKEKEKAEIAFLEDLTGYLDHIITSGKNNDIYTLRVLCDFRGYGLTFKTKTRSFHTRKGLLPKFIYNFFKRIEEWITKKN